MTHEDYLGEHSKLLYLLKGKTGKDLYSSFPRLTAKDSTEAYETQIAMLRSLLRGEK